MPKREYKRQSLRKTKRAETKGNRYLMHCHLIKCTWISNFSYFNWDISSWEFYSPNNMRQFSNDETFIVLGNMVGTPVIGAPLSFRLAKFWNKFACEIISSTGNRNVQKVVHLKCSPTRAKYISEIAKTNMEFLECCWPAIKQLPYEIQIYLKQTNCKQVDGGVKHGQHAIHAHGSHRCRNFVQKIDSIERCCRYIANGLGNAVSRHAAHTHLHIQVGNSIA